MLFVASGGSKGLLYDLEDNTVVRNYALNSGGDFSSAYCAASDTVVSHQVKNCSFFLSAHTQQPVHRSFTPEPVLCTAASRCGTFLVGGTATGSLLVWNLLTGKLLRNFKAHLRAVHCVAFSPATDLVVSASEDSLCKVWTLASLLNLTASDVLPLGTFTGHTRSVLCCTFFHHSGLVLTGSSDRTCRVFDSATCESVTTMTLGDAVTAVAVAPDDSRLVAGMQSGYLFFSDAAVARPPHESASASGSAPDRLVVAPQPWSKLRSPSEDTHHSAINFIAFCSKQYACTRVLTASRDGTFLWHDASTAKLVGEAMPKQRLGVVSCCAVPKRPTPTLVAGCVGIDKNPVDPTADDLTLLRTVVRSTATASTTSRKRTRDDGAAVNAHATTNPTTGEGTVDDELEKVAADNEQLETLLSTLEEKISSLSGHTAVA